MDKKKGYIIEIDLDDKEAKEMDMKPGTYTVTVEPNREDVQVTELTDDRYIVAYDYSKKGDYTLDEFMNRKDLLCEKAVSKLIDKKGL